MNYRNDVTSNVVDLLTFAGTDGKSGQSRNAAAIAVCFWVLWSTITLDCYL